MEDPEYFREKARQCQRLMKGLSDPTTLTALESLAAEFDAKAAAIEARIKNIGLLGDGEGDTAPILAKTDGEDAGHSD